MWASPRARARRVPSLEDLTEEVRGRSTAPPVSQLRAADEPAEPTAKSESSTATGGHRARAAEGWGVPGAAGSMEPGRQNREGTAATGSGQPVQLVGSRDARTRLRRGKETELPSGSTSMSSSIIHLPVPRNEPGAKCCLFTNL